jgi:hypothetical protein
VGSRSLIVLFRPQIVVICLSKIDFLCIQSRVIQLPTPRPPSYRRTICVWPPIWPPAISMSASDAEGAAGPDGHDSQMEELRAQGAAEHGGVIDERKDPRLARCWPAVASPTQTGNPFGKRIHWMQQPLIRTFFERALMSSS